MADQLERTLGDFVRIEIASPEEWHEWETIRGSTPPATQTRVSSRTALVPFVHEQDPPSAEYTRSVALRAEFTARLRSKLSDGGWEVWARVDTPASRQKLERLDWATAGVVTPNLPKLILLERLFTR